VTRFLSAMPGLLLAASAATAATPMVATSGSSFSPHAIAVRSNGILWAWGMNDYGQLGDGTTVRRNSPVQVGGGYTSAVAGRIQSFAFKTDGSLWAWGYNGDGRLGDGGYINRFSPVLIGNGFKAVAADDHTLAVKTDGSLWSWGGNYYGQLGDGTNTGRNSPAQIGSGYAAVAAGGNFSIALKTDGSLWAWGYNQSGQLGDGTTADRSSPVQIGTGYASISAGSGHSLAFKTDGSLWAWGYNRDGELGDGSISNRSSPVLIGSDFVSAVAGADHSLALKADGSLWTWGYNYYGQLGDGTSTERHAPVQIGSGFASIAAGGYYSIAVKTDGTMWAWGENNVGQLGDGTTTRRYTPVQIGAALDRVPADVSATASGGDVVVSWGPVAGASSYNIYMANAPGVTAAGYAALAGGHAHIGATSPFMHPNAAVGSTYYVVVTAVSAAGESVESLQVAVAVPATLRAVSGWNLAGNGSAGAINVATAFSDATKVITVWKWVPAKTAWAFYTPTLSDGGAAFAASKGYEFLTSVSAGEGFWVNAKAAFASDLPSATPVPPSAVSSMSSGWNLIAIGDNATPRAFNNALSSATVQPGEILQNVTTLWTWDAAQLNWYFYAPSMDLSGALASYIASKSYLDFGSRTLAATTGFWVNMPPAYCSTHICLNAK